MGNNSNLFWQLVEKEHKKARAYCYRLTGGNDNDDLYQDSVIRAFNGFAELRQVESFKPWFYRIINNTFKSRFRRPFWQRLLPFSLETENTVYNENPESLFEIRRRLNYAFQILSVDDRIIVTLAEMDGWKISELADLTGKTEGNIKMRLSRARKKMRQRLSGIYKEKTENMNNQGTNKICVAAKPEKD